MSDSEKVHIIEALNWIIILMINQAVLETLSHLPLNYV